MFGTTKKPEPKQDVKAEILRRKSQAARILELLKKGEPVYTYDLQNIAFNYTMRISELRKEGYLVEAEYVKPGVFRYIFNGHEDDRKSKFFEKRVQVA